MTLLLAFRYTPEQQRELNKELKEYLFCPPEQDEEKLPDVNSVRKVYEIMKQVKIIVRHLQTETEERLRTQYTLGPKADASGGGEESKLGADGGATAPANGGMVGDLDGDGGGFALGTAPAGARPPSAMNNRNGAGGAGQAGAGSASPARVSFGASKEDEGVPAASTYRSREAAYKECVCWLHGWLRLFLANSGVAGSFVSSPDLGLETVDRLKAAKAEFKELRLNARELARSVNEAKQSIDDLDTSLAEKRRYGVAVSAAAAVRCGGRCNMCVHSDVMPARSSALQEAAAGGEDIVDEEEFRLMRQLSAAKKAYRARFQELREAKSSLAEAANNVDELKAQLLSEFEAWFGETEVDENALGETIASGGAAVDEGDVLDDGEAFDRMEMEKVASQDPDSLAYFNAQKRMQSTLRSTRRSGRRR